MSASARGCRNGVRLGHCQDDELGDADRLLDAVALDRRLDRARDPPRDVSSTASTRNRPRTRLPEGTGAGKRTRFVP